METHVVGGSVAFGKLFEQLSTLIVDIILSHVCWGTSEPSTPPKHPPLARRGPFHVSPEGRWGSRKAPMKRCANLFLSTHDYMCLPLRPSHPCQP